LFASLKTFNCGIEAGNVRLAIRFPLRSNVPTFCSEPNVPSSTELMRLLASDSSLRLRATASNASRSSRSIALPSAVSVVRLSMREKNPLGKLPAMRLRLMSSDLS